MLTSSHLCQRGPLQLGAYVLRTWPQSFSLFFSFVGWLVCFLVGQDSDSSYPRHSPTESGSFSEDWNLEIRTRDRLTASKVLWTCYLMCTHTHLLPSSGHYHIPFSKCTQILFRSQVLNHSEMNLSVWLHKANRLEKYVHGVTNSWTQLSDFTFTFHFHVLEKEMATHSSVLAWRIPGMGEPGGLPSMGSHRVGHDWSNLAAAATTGIR